MPFGLLETLIAVSLMGTAVSAAGMIQQGQAAQRQGAFNAAMAAAEAERARKQASIDAKEFAGRQSRVMATRRSLMGATGLSGEGTPLLVDTAMNDEIAFQTEKIRAGGEAEGWALDQEAKMSMMRGQSQRTASQWGAGGTLLTGAVRPFLWDQRGTS